MRYVSFTILIFVLNFSYITASANVCQNIFKTDNSFFSKIRFWKKQTLNSFNEAEIRLLHQIIKADEKIYIKPSYLSYNKNGTYDPYLVLIWNEIPEISKNVIFQFAFNLKIQSKQKMISDFYKRLNNLSIDSISTKSFFTFLMESWINHCEHEPTDFSDWVKMLTTVHQQQKATDLLKWQNELQMAYDNTLASDYWKNVGTEIIQISNLDKDRFEFNLNHHVIKGQIDHSRNRVILEVPREMIKTAAWNPISMDEISRKIQNRQKSLEIYPAFLGANKYFYLLDGNHRFLIDPKPTIKLELSYPLKTSSWSNTFDALGIKQPNQDEILQLYSQNADLIEFIKIKLSGFSSSVDELNRD